MGRRINDPCSNYQAKRFQDAASTVEEDPLFDLSEAE
jgi:hypothetical protein